MKRLKIVKNPYYSAIPVEIVHGTTVFVGWERVVETLISSGVIKLNMEEDVDVLEISEHGMSLRIIVKEEDK